MTTQRMLPLYEAKMIHHFDHRWGTFDHADSARDVTTAEKQNPGFESLPRYWVREQLVDDRLKGRWDLNWLLGWRDIARSTDERTTIAGRFPRGGVGHTMPLMMGSEGGTFDLLVANLTSFALDYVARQKIGGTHVTYSYLTQLPVLPRDFAAKGCPWASGPVAVWMSPRVRELEGTSWEMQAGHCYRWDVERRFWLRAELDAAFFHLYGIERDDVDYIMETFPIVKRKDVAAHGEFRTKLAILDIYVRMQAAIDSDGEYQTVLDPPPGNGPRHPMKEEPGV